MLKYIKKALFISRRMFPPGRLSHFHANGVADFRSEAKYCNSYQGEVMKTFVVIFLATLSAAIGEVLMSYGMKRGGAIDLTDFSQWGVLILSVVRNYYVLAGVVLLAVFFFLYLASLSWADISYVMPLTAMSYIFAAILARLVLKEDVSWFRWVGTAIIVVGIVIVALDNKELTENQMVAHDISHDSSNAKGN